MRTLSCLLLAFAATSATANPAHNQFAAMSDAQRAAAMTGFFKASNVKCGQVTRTFYQGSTKDKKAIWNVACSNGSAWIFMIYPDAEGSTSVLDCKLAKALNAGECFKPFAK